VERIDPAAFLRQLVGRELRTVTGRPNRILRIEGDRAIVGTERSSEGKPVPLAWAEDAVRRLQQEGEVEVSVDSLGYRSAFVGAVLLQVPGARLRSGSPPVVTLSLTR
jgi:hypothetical protein